MISKQGAVQCVFTCGLVLGAALPCFAQSDAPIVQERTQEVGPPTGDPVIHERAVQRERVGEPTVVQERVVERRREGEIYVGGFGGFTWGHDLQDAEGTGSLKGQTFRTLGLTNSVVYGAKIGYFYPGGLNWLGLEAEGFNSTPHIKEGSGLPGAHLRVTTVAFNLIARTTLGCRPDERDRDNRDDRSSWSSLDANARCPLQVYAGVGPGIFFAETSNQFGRSTDNGRVGLNALAGLKYYMTRQFSVFAEYKFNYAQFNFDQAEGSTAGLRGEYLASHAIGGLAMHF
jgi:opacity protein-like surface antigen